VCPLASRVIGLVSKGKGGMNGIRDPTHLSSSEPIPYRPDRPLDVFITDVPSDHTFDPTLALPSCSTFTCVAHDIYDPPKVLQR
jgi:hypothetical protein